MKVISLLQPWASLCFIINPATGKPYKKIETRSFNTKHRGELLIHASNNNKHAIALAMQEPFYSAIGGLRAAYALPTGKIIGKVTITDTKRTSDKVENYIASEWVNQLSDKELAFGDFSPNRYGWLLEDAKSFDEPIPCKGALSLWDLPKELEVEVLTQML